jgi:beta-lactamase superfamily II metal-dependent hydrolase
MIKSVRARLFVVLIVSLLTAMAASAGQSAPARRQGSKELTIYFIDVEGGQSTLMITPAGQSVLIDAGYAGRGDRDLDRVLQATRDAGVDRIDYLLITHFHPDHVGGVAALSARIPITTFIDYGSPLGTPWGADMMAARSFPPYESVRDEDHHLQPRPGDHLPFQGIEATVVSAGGQVIGEPLPGAGGANAACDHVNRDAPDGTENYRSLGVLFRFDRFSFLDIGDLSGDALLGLVCPRSLVGPVSVYLIAHHGNYDTSVPAAYSALRPRVAIMNNGPTKGGAPAAFSVARASAGLEDLWQLHLSRDLDAANSASDLVANVDDGSDGHWLKLTASPDGSFTILNGRTGVAKTYRRATGTDTR